LVKGLKWHLRGLEMGVGSGEKLVVKIVFAL